jgi:hypothetical protein
MRRPSLNWALLTILAALLASASGCTWAETCRSVLGIASDSYYTDKNERSAVNGTMNEQWGESPIKSTE